jgi:hypothetical protein
MFYVDLAYYPPTGSTKVAVIIAGGIVAVLKHVETRIALGACKVLLFPDAVQVLSQILLIPEVCVKSSRNKSYSGQLA